MDFRALEEKCVTEARRLEQLVAGLDVPDPLDAMMDEVPLRPVFSICPSIFEKTPDANQTVKTLCGFTQDELFELFEVVEPALEPKRLGRKLGVSPLDSFFLALCFFHSYGRYSEMARSFNLSRTIAFEAIERTTIKIAAPLTGKYIRPPGRASDLLPGVHPFPDAPVIIDCMFQPCTKPSGSTLTASKFYSEKHRLNGFKTETVNCASTGRVFLFNAGIPAATHDLTIYRKNEELCDEFLGDAKLLADLGYEGINDNKERAVVPIKGSHRTAEEIKHNKALASVRVTVERFYGRMKLLFRIMRDQYRGDRENYPVIASICIALANFHLLKHPLTDADRKLFCLFDELDTGKGAAQENRRLDVARRSREKRRKLAEGVDPSKPVEESG